MSKQAVGMSVTGGPDELAERILSGDRRAVARAISWVENGEANGEQVVANLYSKTGSAKLLGLTGPPGVGKSSLIAALVKHRRSQSDSDNRIGVVSVDPSSPFTNGALLGDRIRLVEHFLDRKSVV